MIEFPKCLHLYLQFLTKLFQCKLYTSYYILAESLFYKNNSKKYSSEIPITIYKNNKTKKTAGSRCVSNFENIYIAKYNKSQY